MLKLSVYRKFAGKRITITVYTACTAWNMRNIINSLYRQWRHTQYNFILVAFEDFFIHLINSPNYYNLISYHCKICLAFCLIFFKIVLLSSWKRHIMQTEIAFRQIEWQCLRWERLLNISMNIQNDYIRQMHFWFLVCCSLPFNK